MQVQERLDNEVEVLRKRLDNIERLRALVQEAPEIIALFENGHEPVNHPNGSATNGHAVKTQKAKASPSASDTLASARFKMIAEYLERVREPQALPVIADQVALALPVVQSLCAQYRDALESQPDPADKRRKLWRVKEGWRALVGM